MEVQGFTNQREYDKIWALTKPASPDTTRKITGFLNMVKDRADEKFTNVTSTGMCIIYTFILNFCWVKNTWYSKFTTIV